MPILNLSVSTQPDVALSASIAELLSEATARLLHKDPAVTAVVVNYVAPENWIVGGKSMTSHGLKSFWLDIKITAGTNTKSQIADYIEAVFQAMGRVLGTLHDTSYIVVHEVPAAAWGFSGTTQEYRYVSGKMKQSA